MPISFVNSADLGDNGGGSNNRTAAYTIGGGANRALVLAIEGDVASNAQTDPAVTYAGTTMLKAIRNDNANATSVMRYDYLYYLLEGSLPAAGSHNFVVTFTAAPNQFVIMSCWEANGVLALDNAVANGPADATQHPSFTSSITTVANNCWAVVMEQHNSNILTTVAGTGVTLRVNNANFDQPAILDSNAAITPAQSYSVTTTLSSGTDVISHTIASFSPAPSGITTYHWNLNVNI